MYLVLAFPRRCNLLPGLGSHTVPTSPTVPTVLGPTISHLHLASHLEYYSVVEGENLLKLPNIAPDMRLLGPCLADSRPKPRLISPPTTTQRLDQSMHPKMSQLQCTWTASSASALHCTTSSRYQGPCCCPGNGIPKALLFHHHRAEPRRRQDAKAGPVPMQLTNGQSWSQDAQRSIQMSTSKSARPPATLRDSYPEILHE